MLGVTRPPASLHTRAIILSIGTLRFFKIPALGHAARSPVGSINRRHRQRLNDKGSLKRKRLKRIALT
eukprot:6082724-Karenia_brevis.AAC.1